MREHPLRESLVLELHARPYEHLVAPEQASHLALFSGVQRGDEDRDHLEALLARFDAPRPAADAAFFSADLGPFRVRWERHTEFSSFTFFRRAPFDDPFAEPVIDLVPQDWLADLPGEVIAAVHVAVEPGDAPERSREELARLFGGNTFIGCGIAGGRGTAWSDLRMHGDRFARILVRDAGMSQRQAGRHVMRLLEVHTYRMMALLGLPEARRAGPQIFESGRLLAEITARMSDPDDASTDPELLGQLSKLAADVEEIAAATAHRFGASDAYHQVVQERLSELREVRIEGLQTFSEFLGRHLTPAMRACQSTARRQEAVAQRAARVTSLLRARVEVALEQQNRDLLKSMDRRARLQLRLQETVEGLSVVAISYYLVGLMAYILKGAKATGLPFQVEVATALVVPLVALTVWFGLKRLKRRMLLRSPE